MPNRSARPRSVKKSDEVQQKGAFAGIAQEGLARPHKRAIAPAEELMARACQYIQNQLWAEGAKILRKAIKVDPDYAEAYNNLGLCLLYSENTEEQEEAVEVLKAALECYPGWYIAEANLGLAFQRIGNHEIAAKAYSSSLTKRRKQPAVWVSLGDVQAARNMIDDALASYKNSLALSPENDLAFYRIGMLQARRNNLAEAEPALKRALELEPENADAIAVLGAIAARHGRLNEARDRFQHVMSAEQVPAPALRGMHRLQVFQKGLRDAFGEWKSGMPEANPLALCYYNLGLAHVGLGHEAEAKDAFAQVSKLQPKWPEPLIWNGFLAAMAGDAVLARTNWEAAMNLKPNALVKAQLGYLSVAMGLQQESDVLFAEAIEMGRAIPTEAMHPDANIPKAK